MHFMSVSGIQARRRATGIRIEEFRRLQTVWYQRRTTHSDSSSGGQCVKIEARFPWAGRVARTALSDGRDHGKHAPVDAGGAAVSVVEPRRGAGGRHRKRNATRDALRTCLIAPPPAPGGAVVSGQYAC
jgi:hypothetical protein